MGKITRQELSPKLNAEIDALGEKINLDLFLAAVTFSTNVFSATDNRIKQYVNGLRISFKSPVTADLNNSVIKINGFANAPLKKANGAALNKVYKDGVYTFVYSDGNFIIQGEGGEYGNANKDQVLSGVTIGTENGLVTGTMPNRSAEAFHQPAKNISAVASDKVYLKPPNGYYDGESWVYSQQPDLHPNNFLAGKSLFGISGAIPNYGRATLGQGYTNPKSYRADGGGSLVVEPNTGYYEQGVNANNFGSIILSDPNFVAANILQGKSIFGVNGAATVASMGGKKMATGTFPRRNLVQKYKETITGLGFTPTHVFWYVPTSDTTQVAGGVGIAISTGGIRTPDRQNAHDNGIFVYYATGSYGGGGYGVNDIYGSAVTFSYGQVTNIPLAAQSYGDIPATVWIAFGD